MLESVSQGDLVFTTDGSATIASGDVIGDDTKASSAGYGFVAQVIGNDGNIENGKILKEACGPILTCDIKNVSRESFIGCDSLTNNTAEGTAIVEAFIFARFLISNVVEMKEDLKVIIRYDNTYVANVIAYKNISVPKNFDLLSRAINEAEALEQMGVKICWIKIKSHSGDKLNDRADLLANIGSRGRHSISSELGYMRHILLQKKISIKSKCYKCQNEATNYYKRPGILLCNSCSPNDDYFGEVTKFDKSIVTEINSIKRNYKNFEKELRNSVNSRSCEETKSEAEFSNGPDSEESQQFLWENNYLWPKNVFKIPPPSKRGDRDRPTKPTCDSDFNLILGDDKVYNTYPESLRDQFTNEVISLLENEAIIEDADENRDSINSSLNERYMIVDIVYCDAEKDGKCYPRYWKHVPLFLIKNLKNSSEAVCFIQEALNPNSYRIAYGYETDKNLDSSEVDEMGAEALLNLERDDWSKFTIERFQPRLNVETKRGIDQKMKWIGKCVEKGQISRANKCLVTEHSNAQNAEEVFEILEKTIMPTRHVGCEEDEKAISNSELKKDKNISVQSSFIPTIKDLHKTIMSLKCLTSPGINGLRNDHLKALWAYSDLDEIDDDVNNFRKAYYSFICMMFQPNNETGDLWRLENMVKTIAFLKPNGKIRNIAIEDVNRKVACTTIFCHIKDEADKILNESWQVCMSRGGTFKKVAYINAHEAMHPNQTKLEVDGDNAFNSASQIKIMALVKKHFPTAWFFVKNILQTQNLWYFGGEDGIRKFKMKDGILQGDPMSMLLYCISIMPMIKGIDEILKEHNGFTCWYADDGSVRSDVMQTYEVLNFMNASSRENGYVINMSKCKIHLQKFDNYQIALNHKKRLVQVYGVSYDNVRIHKDDLLSANILYDPSEDGLNIVGCPMGTNEFIKGFIKEKLDDLNLNKQKLLSVPDYQLRWLLLSNCYARRPNHLWCQHLCENGSEMDNFRKAFQDSLMEVLDSIIQVKDRVSLSMWNRICREVEAPIRCGGLGLGVPKEKTLTAFLANFINIRESLYKNIDGYGRECDLLARYSAMEKAGKVVTDEEWRTLPGDLLKANKALKLLNEVRMKNKNHELITMRDLFTFERKIKKKVNGDDIVAYGGETTSILMFKALFEDDIVNDIKNMRFAESFRSVQQYYGKIGDNTFLCGRFLNVFPIGPNKVNNKVWQTMMSYYLRLPILEEFDRRCEVCKDSRSEAQREIDVYGSHVCSGCPMSGNRILRHDLLANLIKYVLIRSGYMAKTEHHSFRVADPNSNYRSDIHVFGPNQDTAYDIQLKGAIKSNRGLENRSAKDYSNAILNQGFAEKTRKYLGLAKASNVSFVPLILLDTGKAHRAAAKFMKWLCYVAIPGSRCQKNKSIAIGNAWIGRFSFLIQKQNALTIQNSITNARQKEMRNGSHVKHGYSTEFLDSDRVANVYFTSDVDAKSRISGLNDFYRINLNDIRRAGAHDDGVFNECKISDQESDDDTDSIISKDNGDDADDDDDDDDVDDDDNDDADDDDDDDD